MGFLSKKKKHTSKDGKDVDILYYQDQEEKGYTPPRTYGEYIEEIEKHVEKVYPDSGGKGTVFHEILSDTVHVDVHVLPPVKERDFYVLYTTGMSDLPMTMPEGVANPAQYERAEMVMYLPPDWEIGQEFQLDSEIPDCYYWPLFWIKYLARFPHEYHTWLGVGHTLPNGPDYEPLGEGTKMGGFLLLPTFHLEPLSCRDGAVVNFLWAVPMYREEIEYKLENGFQAILDLLEQHKTPLPVNPLRPNYCTE